MPQYQTRHMEAQRELVHCAVLVKPGEKFECISIDADYYRKHGMAKDADAADAAVTQPTQPAAVDPTLLQAPLRRRRSAEPEPAATAKPVEAAAAPPPAAADQPFVTAADAGAP